MIKLNNISHSYDGKEVFKNFCLEIPDKGVFCITGPSGCGKTTLLRIIAGLIKVDSGEISGLPEKTGIMFQEDRLLPWCTVLENVANVSENYESARMWLSKMELEDEMNSYPSQLSGGMRRRVAIARALSYNCGLLLMDEPLKGLDPLLIDKICPLIINHGIPIIVVTHSIDEANLLGGNLVRLEGPTMYIESGR